MPSQASQDHMKDDHPGLRFSRILSQLHDYVQLYQHLGFKGFPKSADRRTGPSLASAHSSQQMRHRQKGPAVIGSGNPHARLMFIGEASGSDLEHGESPFSNAAGELLTRIIEAIKLRREDVYLCHIVAYRSEVDRPPESCDLYQEIERIQPDIICTLGTLAAQSVLKTQETVDQLRGTFYSYHDILVMPTYHPAHLLEHPENKRQVWHDMQMIQKAYVEFDENV